MPFRILNDEGEEIQISELPEEMIRSHPAYTREVDRSVARRKQLAAAREELQRLRNAGNQNEDTDDTDEPSVAQTAQQAQVQTLAQPQIDPAQLAQTVLEQVLTTFEQRQQQQQSLQAEVSSLLTEFHLPAEMAGVISVAGTTEARRTMADQLSRAGLRFDPAPEGAKPNTEAGKAVVDSALKRLGVVENPERLG